MTRQTDSDISDHIPRQRGIPLHSTANTIPSNCTAGTMATQLHSDPNSQASSFGDSQGSYQRPTSDHYHLPEAPQRDITPSTSLSNPSSQENITHKMQNSPSSQKQRMEIQKPHVPVAPMAHMTSDYVGAKRTADGQVKERSPTSPTSVKYGHSRNSSMTSRGSQIGEVCLFKILDGNDRVLRSSATIRDTTLVRVDGSVHRTGFQIFPGHCTFP